MRRYNITVGQHEYVIDVQEMAADSFRVWIGNHELDVQITGDQDIAEATITPEITPTREDGEAVERPAMAYRPPAPETLPPLPGQPVGRWEQLSELTAPMPGTILTVEVAPQDTVKRGQVLLILEAMKMKNYIKSPLDGVIAEVAVRAGQVVGYGNLLLKFESASP